MFLKLGLWKCVGIYKYLIAVFMECYHIVKIPDMFIDNFKKIKVLTITQDETVLVFLPIPPIFDRCQPSVQCVTKEAIF